MRRSWVAVVLAASLCGCGGAGARPAALSASSTLTSSPGSPRKSPSPSPSPVRTGPLTTGPGVLPGEKPPVEPSPAAGQSSSAAYAFSIYFIQALDWSIATNDPWLLQQISAPSCAACGRYIDGLRTLKAAKKREVGGRIEVASSRPVAGPYPAGTEFAVEFTLNESAITILPINKHIAADHGDRSVVYVGWSGSGWQVMKQAAA